MSEREPQQISFDDELRKLVRASPFIPFVIVTASGDRYEITDSVQAAVGSSTVGVFLARTGWQLIRKNQITAIHVHETAA
jgi:hypothetical protein